MRRWIFVSVAYFVLVCFVLVTTISTAHEVYTDFPSFGMEPMQESVILRNSSSRSNSFTPRRRVLEFKKIKKGFKANSIERQFPDASTPATPAASPPAPQPSPAPAPAPAPPCYACLIVPLIAAAVAVGISVPFASPPEVPNFNPTSVVNTSPQRIPTHFRTISSRGNLTDDGCGRGRVLFDDNNCYPLLRPCQNNSFLWTTVDPITRRGRCSPRLCGRERVFVGRSQLCHDIDDPSECTGGRRLYYTAYGDPLCDCPIGQFPFPTEQDNCVPLFTQGPCPTGQVFSVLENGFGCAPAECQPAPPSTDFLLQLVPGGDGFCYPLGSQGPCSGSSELLGYDTVARKAQCVDINDPNSMYFESPQLKNFIERNYNQRSPEYNAFEITLIAQNTLRRNDSSTRRQDLNTNGVFRIPGESPTTLLNPCRPGFNDGDNYKCSNPLLPRLRRRQLLQAVQSAFACPGGAILQAKGTCGGNIDSANCGPTYEFSRQRNLNGRCQKSIL